MYIRHVSFQDLSPSLTDDQVRSLKLSDKPISHNNPFIHVPPEYKLGCADSSLKSDGQSSSSVSNYSIAQAYQGYNNIKTSQLAFEPLTQQQQDSALRAVLGRTLSGNGNSSGTGSTTTGIVDNNSDPVLLSGVGRSRSGFSSASSASTSLTRGATASSSSSRIPPGPSVSILKHRTEDLPDEPSAEDIDLTLNDPEIDKHIDKVTTNNTLENSGNAFGTGYTTSAFANLNELEDKIMKKKKNVKDTKKSEPQKKKKSYSEMTDEELAELEKQLQSGGRQTHADFSNFDFSQQNRLFIGETRPSLIGKGSANTTKSSDIVLTYPSRPSVTHRAISLTREHVDYRKKFDMDTTTRTAVCFLNGRKHTWATADWFINQAARDGDHLVIVSNLPMYEDLIDLLKKSGTSSSASEHANAQSKLEEFSFDGKIKNKSPSAIVELPFHQLGMIINEVDELTRFKCESIMNYYTSMCEDKVMKITVELVKERSFKPFVTHVMNLYRPQLHIVSTISTNLSIKFRNGHVKLPNFLYRHFWVPTLVIPYEFIDPYLMGETKKPLRKSVTCKPRDKAFALLDKCIKKSLIDSMGAEEQDIWRNNDQSDMVSIDSAPNNSVLDYFPTSPENIYKKQQIEKLGYIPPVPTRIKTNPTGPAASRVSSRSSRRSSRVYFADEPGMYKVKSLLADDDDSANDVTRTRSDGHAHTYTHNRHLSPSFAISKPNHLNSSTSPKTSKRQETGTAVPMAMLTPFKSEPTSPTQTTGPGSTAAKAGYKPKTKFGVMLKKLWGKNKE